MNVYVGTSGYSYPEWKGSFYPAKFPAKQMLGYYAERFRTVEINNTFYRPPTAALLEGWAAQVPADFRFVLKALAANPSAGFAEFIYGITNILVAPFAGLSEAPPGLSRPTRCGCDAALGLRRCDERASPVQACPRRRIGSS